MTSATLNGHDVAAMDLEDLLGAQEVLRAQMKTLMARLEVMRNRVEAAEAAADEADALRMQVRALTARLDGERTTRVVATPNSRAAADGLREAYDELLANHAAVVAERDQLARACEALEARLAEAEDISTEEVANIKAERDDWLTFAEELERELVKVREEQGELEGLAESSMSELTFRTSRMAIHLFSQEHF
jgi:chromosome segregation ATPase